MTKNFASTGDMAEKKITFAEIGREPLAFTAEGDPNSGIIVGDDGVIVIDAQATPAMARPVIERVARSPTSRSSTWCCRTTMPCACSAPPPTRRRRSSPPRHCRAMIVERGQEDWDSEYGRFPRLFQAAESDPRA